MSAMDPLCHLIGIQPSNLSKEENLLLEAELFSRICKELIEAFREQYREYFRLMKLSIEMENLMLEEKLARLIIQDILSTNEYDLNGIAYYTNSYIEVIEEILAERNTSPSASFLRRLIDLHRSVRCDIYNSLIKKITSHYLEAG